MANGIKIAILIFDAGAKGQFQPRLLINAVQASGDLPPEVFVFERRTLPSGNTTLEDVFINVASIPDLNDHPVNAPPSLPDDQFFRVRQIDLAFRNRQLLDVTVEKIKADLEELVRNLNDLEDAQAETTFSVGPPP